MKKLTVALAALVLVLAGIIAVMTYVQTHNVAVDARQGSAPFNETAVKSFKISALTYRYTNIIYRERVLKVGNWSVPFTDAHLGVRYDGVMEIGVDASQATVAQSGDTITITLPPAKILSHTLVPGTTQVLFDVSHLAPNTVADYTALFDSEQSAMEQRAIDSGMLTTATTSAQEQLKDFVGSLPGMETYTVTVKTSASS